jgi:hypothetical protein
MEKSINIVNIICLLLVIGALVFLALHPLNCPTNATTPLNSLLRLFCG